VVGKSQLSGRFGGYLAVQHRSGHARFSDRNSADHPCMKTSAQGDDKRKDRLIGKTITI
jgi:hypothetical protein